MAQNFTTTIHHNGNALLAVIIPALRKDGMHYEVNIPGLPRFYMKWSVLDRFDIIPEEGIDIPNTVVLEVSDAIEKKGR